MFSNELLSLFKYRPDALGEFLRAVFFKHECEDDFGCYTTFELNDDVEELPPTAWGWQTAVSVWHPQFKIEMNYFWDGDGYLSFKFPGGRILENHDCKKNYVWEWKN